jgi:FkbM family methyltransferase
VILSYAQNFEDVILWRALEHLEKGFYIDIGAQDPVLESVSFSFYEKGWRGVHVEPTPAYARKLREARPDETVLQVAVGTVAGVIPFWEFPDTGLSTGSALIAAEHRVAFYKAVPIQVTCVPLSQILDAQGGRPIHWLKIDVEGMEDDVIDSWPPSLVRPWIVVVESIKPLTQEESYSAWEPKLLKLGYQFVYFDGINRYYVGNEHNQLMSVFGLGPNVFDRFELARTSVYARRLNAELTQRSHELGRLARAVDVEKARADQQVHAFSRAIDVWEASAAALTGELQAKNGELQAKDGELQAKNEALASRDQDIDDLRGTLVRREREAAAALQARDGEIGNLKNACTRLSQIVTQREAEIWAVNQSLALVRASTSWRVSAPLRWASRSARGALRPLLELGLGVARRYPALKPILWKVVATAPPIREKLNQFAQVRSVQSLPQAPLPIHLNSTAAPLSLRARQIFADLDVT